MAKIHSIKKALKTRFVLSLEYIVIDDAHYFTVPKDTFEDKNKIESLANLISGTVLQHNNVRGIVFTGRDVSRIVNDMKERTELNSHVTFTVEIKPNDIHISIINGKY